MNQSREFITLADMVGMDDQSSNHHFGVDPLKLVNHLRSLANDIESGQVLVTAVEQTEAVGSETYGNTMLRVRFYTYLKAIKPVNKKAGLKKPKDTR